MKSHGHIGDLVNQAIRRYHLDRRVRQSAAMHVWDEVVGRDIARNAWPSSVRDGVLHVRAANHAWVQTLHLMRVQILDALNARLGEQILNDIRVTASGSRTRAASAGGADAGGAPRQPLPPLTREERERVRDLAAPIEDTELRARVMRAAAGLIRLRRLREAQGWRACRRCGHRFRGRGHTCPACTRRR